MPTPSTSKWPRPKFEDEWEDMVLDAMRLRWTDPNASRNGRRGQRQHGVDVFGSLRGSAIGAQAKNSDTIAERDALLEIEDAEGFTPALRHYTLAIGGPRDAGLQEAMRRVSAQRSEAGRFSVDVLFFEDVCQELARRSDLVEKYWGSFVRADLKAALATSQVLRQPVLDEETARNCVKALPEFRAFAAYLEAISEGGLTTFVHIEGVPDLEAARGSRERCWLVAVRELHETHAAIAYRFLVDVDTGEVAETGP